MSKKKSIARGRRGSGGELSGIRAVAERAGVSVSSVSRAFSPTASASPDLRQRVMRAAQAVGYEPDGIARSLRRGATATIGCVVANIANPTFAQIITGAGVALQRHGYALLIANSIPGVSNDGTQVRLLRQRRVDGMLVSVVDEGDLSMRRELAGLEQPSVILDRDVPGCERAGRVMFDHRSGMRAAVAALAQLGHTSIAFIGGSMNVRPTRERSRAFEDACAEFNLSGTVRCGAYSESHGEVASQALLAGRAPPTALIAGGNQVLVGVLRTLRALQLTIPGDVSLVTCDHIPLMDALEPRLACLERDLQLLGREGAEMLVSMINGGTPEQRTVPVEFNFGPSCAPPRG